MASKVQTAARQKKKKSLADAPWVKLLLGIVVVAGLIFGGKSVYDLIRGDASARAANTRTFIDAETRQAFQYEITPTTTFPVKSPFTGKQTGVLAELCYWTKDGQIKDTPTAVLLNQEIGEKGPTFCPDCGRLVVGHNPKPRPGDRPPPTKEEYFAKHGEADLR